MNVMRARAVPAVLVMLALTAAGCSSITNVMGINPTEADPCDWLSQQTGRRSPNALDLVVIVDRSDSMSTRENRKVRDWYDQIFGNVQSAEHAALAFDNLTLPTPARIRIGGFDGSNRVDWQPSIGLPKLAGGGKYSGQFGRNVESCVKGQFVKVETSASKTPGTDVLGAMGSAGRESGTDEGPRKMIVVSDGIQTLGCANLRKLELEKYERVGKVTPNCVAQSGVPGLTGWDVVLHGVGNPAEGWPAPRAASQVGLTSLWRQLCASAVGRTGSCELDSREPDVTKKEAAEGVADRLVPIKVKEQTPPIRTVTLPSKVLFDTAEWTLRQDGRRAIDKALSDIAPGDVEWIRVYGYTDSRGGDRYNQGLSEKRAKAVAGALGDLGLEHIHAEGEGEADQACSEHGLSGQALAAAQECNRRVKIEYKVRT